MGRKGPKVIIAKPANAPVATYQAVASSSAAVTPSSSSIAVTTSSASASANSYQNLIRMLGSSPEGATEERNELIRKLAAEFKTLSIANALNTRKEPFLAEELQQLQASHEAVSKELAAVKAEYDTASSKHAKLKMLSSQLSERTKQSDLKSAQDILVEQQKRVKLTQSFSAAIATISSKLDSITARRETVVTENIRLKGLLKKVLEEFDAEQLLITSQQQQEQEQEKEEEQKLKQEVLENGKGEEKVHATEEAEGAVVEEGDTASGEPSEEQVSTEAAAAAAMDGDCDAPIVAAAVVAASADVQFNEESEKTSSTLTATVAAEGEQEGSATSAVVDGSNEDAASEAAMEVAGAPAKVLETADLSPLSLTPEQLEQQKTDAAAMALEDDTARLLQLRAVEQDLRARTGDYAARFQTFQSRLADCNEAFKGRQASIEALNKEITLLEKDKAKFEKRTSDSVLSTKIMLNMATTILSEQQRQAKMVDKYNALMDTLQREINSVGSGGSSSGGSGGGGKV